MSPPDPPRFRTVKTLAEVPGGYERGVQTMLRGLSIDYGVRFHVIDDDAEPLNATGVTPPPDRLTNDSTEWRDAA